MSDRYDGEDLKDAHWSGFWIGFGLGGAIAIFAHYLGIY